MARPIIPTAVRRESHGGTVEVRSSGGYWLNYNLLSTAAQVATMTAMTRSGYAPEFPTAAFYIDLSVQKDQDEQPETDERERIETDTKIDTDEDGQDTERQQQQQQQQQQQNQQQNQQQQEESDMTMENIVRRIAGEMDDEQQGKIDAALNSLSESIDQRLADFKPENNEQRVVPVCTRIIVERPEVTLTQDGVFHQSMPDLLFNMQLGIHTYLPGSPGTGKSHAAAQAAEAMGWKFGSISFGPSTPESRLVGGMTASGEFFEPKLLELVRYAMENPDSGAAMCLDEMDNGHGGVQATLNSLLANGWMTAPNGDHLVIGSNMVFIACANTYGTGPTAEFSGRNKLDAATLDRFAYLPWEIDLGLEEVLVRRFFGDDQQDVASHWLDVWRTARSNVASHGLKVFVTPRGAQMGARMVAAGRPADKALAQVLGNKVPSDQWSKINPL